MPLIISAPGFRGGRSAAMVELMDIFPTVAELSGLSIPDTVQGESLVPILNDPNQRVREASLSIDGSGYSLRSERWAYIRYNDDTEELYDMVADPGQITNLAINPEKRSELRNWRKKLDTRLNEAGLKRKAKRG